MSVFNTTFNHGVSIRGRLILSGFLVFFGIFSVVFIPRASTLGFRQSVLSYLLPVYDIVIYSQQNFSEIRVLVQSKQELEAKNSRLSAANSALEGIVGTLEMYRLLNERYADLLSLQLSPSMRMIAGRVVADLRSPFVHTLLVNTGYDHGVISGQAALGSKGIVGRVIAVGKNSSRILLLTDLNSHLPVVVGAERARAIMSGDNSARPVLEFFAHDQSFKNGDRVMTSGNLRNVPIGIRVGGVVIDDVGAPRVELQQNLDWVDFVRIVISDETMPPDNAIDVPPELRRRSSSEEER